jgi:hypothetical protein
MESPLKKTPGISREKLLSVALDLAVIGTLLGLRYTALVRGDPGLDATSSLPNWWWNWGSIQDWLLVGADAGNWASNASAWAAGEALDPHRLPTYTALTAWFSSIFGDVVFAGHMVNHGVSALLCVLAYALGRACTGGAVASRLVGIGAGLLCAWSPELVNSQVFFGVDPTLQFVLLLLALCSFMAMKKGTWPWILATGIALGVALCTHYLALLFVPVSLATLGLMRRSRILRARFILAALLIAWLVFQGLTRHYDDLSLRMIASVFTEGVAGSDGRIVGNTPMASDTASGLVLHNLPSAPRLAVQRGLRALKVEGMPWGVLVGLFWIGIVGWGLAPKKSTSLWDWRTSAFLLGALSPLILLEASRAPDRYALFSRPLIFICVLRGVLSTVTLCMEGLFKAIPRFRGRLRMGVGFLSSILAVGLLLGTLRGPFWGRWALYPPTDEGLGDRAVAKIIQQSFPRKGNLVTTSQALEYFSGRTRCPSRYCPQGGNKAIAQCLDLLLAECKGAGPIPYVLSASTQHGLGDQRNVEVDALIRSEFTALGTHRTEIQTLSVYSLERKALRTLSNQLKKTP